MKSRNTMILALAGAALSPALAHGQYTIDWCTIDGGGGDTFGGTFTLSGTIGQPDAGVHAGGTFQVSGGYWVDLGGSACYANCDGSSGTPALTANDFQCFLNKFAAGESYANCDESTGTPSLTANDFQCFLNKYAAGCS
jgi:hypothetical protein